MDLNALKHEDEILRVLRAAQERIRKPQNWIESPRAQSSYGDLSDGSDPTAIRWCALGAIDWVMGECVDLRSPVVSTLKAAAIEMGFSFVAETNWHGYDACHEMFSRAQELRLAEIMEVAAA